jgi:3-methyl-2-oxobutanoate hydroxymethyltransferase
MSSSPTARLTAPDIMARKGAEKIVCLTAFTAPMAALLALPFKSQDRN